MTKIDKLRKQLELAEGELARAEDMVDGCVGEYNHAKDELEDALKQEKKNNV